jgi:hypothetical protein
MGIAICWSGSVTVWSGIGIGMYDMVLVSKCSMAVCGLAVNGEGVGVGWAHARDDVEALMPRKERRSAQWQAHDSGLGPGNLHGALGLEVERCGRQASGEDGDNTAHSQFSGGTPGYSSIDRRAEAQALTHQAITL